MSASQDEIPPPPPPPPSSPQTPTQQTPHTVSTIKLPILKKGEYDIWAMKMEHYLAHTDYPIWEVIQNGNGPVSITTDTQGQIKVLPPRTAEEIVARERERKARTTLLMALPEDHLAKFHKMTDAKEMWDAIKSRFGGNNESKKMQKYILKQQFEGFTISNTEGLHKGYDKFQRADSLNFDDLYNNLRVFESDVKGSTTSSSSPQNVAFVSENTSSTNEVSTAYCAPNPSGQNSQTNGLEVASGHDLNENEKVLQKDWHFARECRIKGNQDNRRRDAWNSGTKDGSRTGKKEDSKALVTIDGEGVDWTNHSEDEDYLNGFATVQTQTNESTQRIQDFNGAMLLLSSKGCISLVKVKLKWLIDFEDVMRCKELQHFNLFSVSQMCDKKNKVLFTDSECLVLSSEFKLPDENKGISEKEDESAQDQEKKANRKLKLSRKKFAQRNENLDYSKKDSNAKKNCLHVQDTEIWVLEDLPYGKKSIVQKVGFIEIRRMTRGVCVRNKARLGCSDIEQDGRIDKMSAFLYGKIDEEVYVSQPPGFLDLKYPQKVYKVVALYGLHQAPRAWYATLSTFLLKNGYKRGTIDKTLFLKKDKHDIILVQVYVDDIIFGSTKKSWCDEFEALMKSRFQMSSMGELTFFFGLQVKQKPDGIFISQGFQSLQSLSHLSAAREFFRLPKANPKLVLCKLKVLKSKMKVLKRKDEVAEDTLKVRRHIKGKDIEADKLLAEKLQEQEREQFTIEKRAKFLHDTIAAQRRFLAQQRSEAIRNRPPTKNQLRNQMMTYLKHVGNFKHATWQIKKFEGRYQLYERLIKRMNEKGVDSSKSEVIKEESKEEIQKESKEEKSTRKRKLGTRKKMKSRKRRYIQNTSEDDSDKENAYIITSNNSYQDEEKEVDNEIHDRKYPIKRMENRVSWK
ncbi:ribonuclease H-like domain-containing protein [Tanacetum coccineum]|uniref:Ribonuclease H-like domain-containing protein n=1 Tax=Tanacetum coccineum TaxID=301880 RepID=A0ABQ5B2K3_9ASTR